MSDGPSEIEVWRTQDLAHRKKWSRLCLSGSDAALESLVDSLPSLVLANRKIKTVACVLPDPAQIAHFEKANRVRMQWFRQLRIVYSSRNPDNAPHEIRGDTVTILLNKHALGQFIESAKQHVASYQRDHYYHEYLAAEGVWFSKDWRGID